MLTQWSDDIVMVELADDPQVSEDLKAAIEHIASEETRTVPHVVLNMGLVSYITSSNISQLLRLRKLITDVGRTLRLCSVDERVYSVLKVAGLDTVFEFSPDPMTALATIQIDDGETAGSGSAPGPGSS
ncbi:MAG: STAS domain-containing protein [Planctomycetota bacterium]